ncbi:PTS sugar transporter subunit IIA [Streptococcus pacificus]|uniref:PTS sugar transporter subunit IIA n=1 Tax=Streptococcus pacificus TaxID=2740577 RepID=A0ABS0ZJ41_9STRE|nr:PTS sugar transporter subunit IIA [Streptococcus pacificus]MBJ8326036.1 PTS sugar transporter subunit IIA [Streptococcus pacificus]
MFEDILLTDVSSQEQLFESVANELEKVGYVTKEYRNALKEREKEFPTGLKIDLMDGSDILYAAIPHTETKYCLTDRIVYVKNSKPLVFKHMINPEEECYVNSFFFIINDKNDRQTDVLSQLMSFFVEKGNLEELGKMDSKDVIKKYLIQKGVLHYD